LDLYEHCVLLASYKPACSCLLVQGFYWNHNKKKWMTQNHVLIQTQEKGSYRVEDVLEFLDWWLPVAEQPEDCLLVMLDWFSAHLHEKVQQLVRKKGHILDCSIGVVPPPW